MASDPRSQFLDVDLGQLIQDGSHMGGCAPRDEDPGTTHALFSSAPALEVIPRSQWVEKPREQQTRSLVSYIYNQRSYGTCTANQTAQSLATQWNFAGFGYRRFSPLSVYGVRGNNLCGSSGNSGSTVSCCMRRARDVGMLPSDTPENVAWLRENNLNPAHVMGEWDWRNERFPQDWEQTAWHFRIDETYDITNFDEFATCLLLGYTVSYGRSGHSILGVDLVYIDGQWCVQYANSWHESWGDQGYGYDSERSLSGAISHYGAVAARNCYVPEWLNQAA